MNEAKSHPLPSRFFRWIARIWSLLLAAFASLMVLTPDPTITGPVPLEDWFLLGLWGAAILGLLIAWRWQTFGAVFAMVARLLREVAWVILRGGWVVGFLIVWALIVPPAILFLVAHRLESKGEL
jgi:hypothetical protein